MYRDAKHSSKLSRRAERARRHPFLRAAAFATATSLAWSFGLAGAARAATWHDPLPPAQARTLTPDEMKAITGAQGPILGSPHPDDRADDSGPAYPWEGGIDTGGGSSGGDGNTGGGSSGGDGNTGGGSINTSTGNKLTALPLVSWTALGGLPVSFTLNHNSLSAHTGELGQKWTFSYDIYLVPLTASGPGTSDGMAVHWGNDLSPLFPQNVDGTYASPTGIHDTLVANGSPVTSYDLTTHDQIKYHFTNPNGTGWYIRTISDENGNTITVNHNTTDYVTSIVDPTSRTLTLAYDSSNRIHTVTDPLSRVWTMTYDSNDDLTQVDFPALGSSTYHVAYAYDTNHAITTLTDKRGNAWTFGYNSDSSLAWAKDPYLNQTSYAYTSSTATVTDANSHATVYTYTGGKVTQVKDALNYHEDYTYDSDYNRTQVTDKRIKVWQYTFDSRGNMLTAKDPYSKVTTYTYNAHNKPLTVSQPLGENVAFTYNASDTLTKIQAKNTGGIVLATTSFTVGTYGLITDKYDPNNHHYQYGYNTNGDLTSVTTPLGNQTLFAKDVLGNTTSRTDALSQVTTYTLDNWKRVTVISYTGRSGDDKAFTYDANDNTTAFSDVTGTTSRTYDYDDRLTNESKGGGTVVSHTYDGTGQLGLLSTTTDANSRTLVYSYTGRDQLYSVAETAGTTYYSYDAGENEVSITNANGTTVTKSYDDASRLLSVTNKNSSGTTLSSFVYAYNDDSQRTSCTEASGDVASYGYDAQGHLTSESRTGTSAYSITYGLDGAGNRTSQTQGGVTTTFTLDNDDELTATSGGFSNSYGYNADGEQTSRTLSGTAYTLAYDYEGQMTSTGGASFTYDAEGRRVSRTVGSTTTKFLYDDEQVLLEKQGSVTVATFTYGNALVRKDGETPLFDGSGSERNVTNSSQTVTGILTLSTFGQTVTSTGSSSNPYMFAATSGYRNDGDAGLVHAGARYYDAQVGRFITRDDELCQQPYVYCDADPVNYVDPDGHQRRRGTSKPKPTQRPKPKPTHKPKPEKGLLEQFVDAAEGLLGEKPGGSFRGGLNGGVDKNGKPTVHFSTKWDFHW